MRLGFIGTGKVGSTLARLWCKAGYEISAVSNRSLAAAQELAEQLETRVVSALEVVKYSDLILLTVSDDAIESVAASLVNAHWEGRSVIHTSGAASLDILQSLSAVGARTGSLHPIFPFADVETAIANLNGASFAIETENENLRNHLYELVAALDGKTIFIPPGKKALYHAALAIASNYTVTLYALAEQLLIGLGAEKSSADNALNVLLEATLRNIIVQGIPQALTGPLSRADLGTIQTHLQALETENLGSIYRDLARLSYPMLQQLGIDPKLIEQIFQEES